MTISRGKVDMKRDKPLKCVFGQNVIYNLNCLDISAGALRLTLAVHRLQKCLSLS